MLIEPLSVWAKALTEATQPYSVFSTPHSAATHMYAHTSNALCFDMFFDFYLNRLSLDIILHPEPYH